MGVGRPGGYLFVLPLLSLLVGCGDGGGGGDGQLGTIGGGVGTTSLVYVTNMGSNTVSGYTINSTTGGLAAVPGSPFAGVSSPSAITVSSNGFFAYVTNSGSSNTVTAFRVGTNGALLSVTPTPTNPNPAAVGLNPTAATLSPDTEFLYVANSGSDTVTAFAIGSGGELTLIPQSSPTLNPISSGGTAPQAMATATNSRVLYVANSGSSNVTAFSIGGTGLLTLVPSTASNPNPISTGGTTPRAMAVAPGGRFLYAANRGSNNVTVFSIGGAGLLTLVPSTGSNPNPISVGGTALNDLTVSSDGQFLYTANGGGNVTAFTIGGSGLLSLIPASGNILNPTVAGTAPAAVTISPNGQFLYVANGGGNVSTYQITAQTGALSPLSPLLGNPFPAGTSPSGIAIPGRP
jgi:6-phosphogluconolactonase